MANIEAYKFKDIPEDKFVTTSWHDDESVQQVFYFTLTSLPFYPLIKSIAIFEISDTARQHEILADFKSAQSEINEDNNVKKFASKPFFKTYF